jgi:hypothetical protein
MDGARKFYQQFPYYCEIHALRADIALDSFMNEMHDNSGFGVCAEGLSALADAMRQEFISLGGQIILNTEVCEVKKDNDGLCNIAVKGSSKTVYTSRICVAALPKNAVQMIRGLNDISYLKYIKMEPLLRIYAVFDSTAWFSNLPKLITDSPIRYIIPVDSKKGTIMISYTDGEDAKIIHKKKDVQKYVMSEIRRLFPNMDIPDPVFFTEHYWGAGCSYWVPGDYNVKVMSKLCLQPLPEKMPCVFMCGESFAENQCWIESALEHADMLLECAAFKKAYNSVKK